MYTSIVVATIMTDVQQDNQKDMEVIDIQLKSLVSEINAKSDDFEEDDPEPPSPPLPIATIGKEMTPIAVPVACFSNVSDSNTIIKLQAAASRIDTTIKLQAASSRIEVL